MLAAIVSTDPVANANDAPRAGAISAVFDEAIVAASATQQTFVVQSLVRPVSANLVATGTSLTAVPSTDFASGETVMGYCYSGHPRCIVKRRS